MTTKQKQHLLAFLGYYTGDVDGIWGNLSQGALEAFQTAYGLPVGQFTDATEQRLREVIGSGEDVVISEKETAIGTFWDEIEFFDRTEFKCTCGGRGCNGYPAEPRERLVRNADSARKHFGKPATVSSGVRCALRNSELPGSAANSLHLSGRAMDFGIPGVSSGDLMAYVRTLPEVHEAYAIDGCYVHMGVQKY